MIPPSRSASLAGKVALITGSSRGIGAAIAGELACHGARIVLHGRDRAALSATRASIEAALPDRAGDEPQILTVTGDVTSAADLAAMRTTIEAQLGAVDILVANAGGNPVPPMPVDQLPEDVWRRTIDGNLTATFLTVQCFLPAMKARGSGAILTISSAAARRAHAGSPIAYAAAKAGIEMFTQDVAKQMGRFGIRANCIAPETILTEDNDKQIPDDLKTKLAAEHPIARLGVPRDVAHAARFLCSDEAGWITGIVLDVAGGAVMSR